jgi:hypothetical protein
MNPVSSYSGIVLGYRMLPYSCFFAIDDKAIRRIVLTHSLWAYSFRGGSDSRSKYDSNVFIKGWWTSTGRGCHA